MSFEVDFEPIGQRIPCKSGETILDAAQHAGIVLNATCGGEGVCGRCIVRVMDGQVSPPNLTEEAELGGQLEDGWRLACQTEVQGDVRIHIPPDTLATAQRTQTEGRTPPIELNPAVRSLTVSLPPPSLADLRSDADRLRDSLGRPDLIFPASVLRRFSNDLRAHEFKVSVFLRGSSVVAVCPANTPALGLAVDLGTTKLAAYLLDLASGETLATAGTMNPQIAFGEDVMARIGHVISKPEGGEQLRGAIVEALSAMARNLCEKASRSTGDIADAVIVGSAIVARIEASIGRPDLVREAGEFLADLRSAVG